MKTFTKFGSCVVSDIFNWLNINNYYVKHNHTGFNVESLIKEVSFNIDEDKLVAETNYALKMLKMTFNHISFREYIKSLDADYFIFDFGDERLPSQKWESGEVSCMIPVTWNTYRTSLKVKEDNKDNIKISDWHLVNRNHDYYKKIIEDYISIIREYFDDEHIIYICSRQADEFINRKNNKVEKLKHEFNKGLSKDELRIKEQQIIIEAENVLRMVAPNIWMIPLPENVLADEAHHFSTHPLHFHYCIYEYLAQCVELIADYDGSYPRSKVNTNITMKKHCTETKLTEIRDLYR